MHLLRKPYLLFLGDVKLKADAKTAFGLRDWSPEHVLGEWSLPEATVSLGLRRLDPVSAAAAGAGSMVIGVAAEGGRVAEAWVPTLVDALDAGLDVVSGMHDRLRSVPRLAEAESRSSGRLIDVRHSDRRWDVATGIKRPGQRVLTVGTDCALGKKYTALALVRSLLARHVDATFRATGQTGIMISGEGIAVDAVISDFVAGAAEALSPGNNPRHWDVVEGQGSLFHPAYAGVTLGLLHGSQPDAIVLCHDPQRTTIGGYPHIPLPSLSQAIEDYLRAGRLVNDRIRCAGISINSSSLDDAAWSDYRQRLVDEIGLAVCDPLRGGVESVTDALLAP